MASNAHTEYTHRINKVVSVDETELSVTVDAADAAASQTFHFRTKEQRDSGSSIEVIHQQMFKVCVDSIQVYGNGQWASTQSLESGLGTARRFADGVVADGINDLNDEAFTFAVANKHLPTDSAGRTVNKLLINAVDKSGRADRETLALQLHNKTRPRKYTDGTQPYEPGQAEAVKAAAIKVVEESTARYVAILEGLGLDVANGDWLHLDAETIIDAAQKRDDGRDAPVEKLTSKQLSYWCETRHGSERFGEAEIADWLILNPSKAVASSGSGLRMDVRDVLYPGGSQLAALTVLHCLAEHRGFDAPDGWNLSVMLGAGVNDVVVTGPSTGIVKTAKARNHTKTRVPTFLGTWHNNLQGLLQMVSGWTALSRHHRAGHDLADKFYVITHPNPARSKVIDHQSLVGTVTPKSTGLFRAWLEQECTDRDVVVPTLSYSKLRLFALNSGLAHHRDFDVVDHTSATALDYLRRTLPGVQLHQVTGQAQSDITTASVEAFAGTGDSELDTAVQSGVTLNMGMNECVSGGKTPDDPETPCTLGIAACFACRRGYRSLDHTRGLVALKQFTEHVRDTDHIEWTNGDASLLHSYVTRTLDEFPATVVAAAENDPDLASFRSLITRLYIKFRRVS